MLIPSVYRDAPDCGASFETAAGICKTVTLPAAVSASAGNGSVGLYVLQGVHSVAIDLTPDEARHLALVLAAEAAKAGGTGQAVR